MSVWSQFHFIRPAWLYGIIPAFLVILALFVSKYKKDSWSQVCDPHLLPYVMTSNKQLHKRWPLITLALAWLICLLALAGPTWQQYAKAVYRKSDPRIFVVDMSYGMDSNDLKPSRAARARYKLLDMLNASKEGRNGLVAYAGEAYTVSPLTEDANTIKSLVSELSPEIMPVQGHDTSSGLRLAEKLLQQAGVHRGDIILITASNVDNSAIQTAKTLAAKGIHTSVLGIGAKQETPVTLGGGTLLKDDKGNIVITRLEANNLKKLAMAGEGNFSLFTADNTDLKRVLQATFDMTQQQAKISQQKIRLWQDEGRYLIFLLIPLVLLAFRRGWLMELLR